MTFTNEADVEAIAQQHFVEGVKYYLEAKNGAKDPLIGHLLSKPIAEIAYERFSQAIELNPKLAMAYLYRAATASLLDAPFEDVITDLHKAVEADPDIYVEVRQTLEELMVNIRNVFEQVIATVNSTKEGHTN